MTEKDYFAFVESISSLPEGGGAEASSTGPWRELALRRREMGFAEPTHEIWLDCIGSEYFSELSWVDQPFEESIEEHRRRRREQIAGLERSEMVALNFAVSALDKEEIQFLGVLTNAIWVSVRVGDGGGIPVVVGAEFEDAYTGGAIRSIVRLSEAGQRETDRLLSVFNVDFIPPIDYDDDGEPGAIVPKTPLYDPKQGKRHGWAYSYEVEPGKPEIDPRLGAERYLQNKGES